MLSDDVVRSSRDDIVGLNAPSGVGRFQTQLRGLSQRAESSLNAPCGAGCFLTAGVLPEEDGHLPVLMHLLVLGTF